jgi:hypothetical protein
MVEVAPAQPVVSVVLTPEVVGAVVVIRLVLAVLAVQGLLFLNTQPQIKAYLHLSPLQNGFARQG